MGLGSVGRVGFVEVGFSGSCCVSLRLFERYRSGGEGSVVGRRRLFLSLASIFEVASVFPDLGFGLRVTASGAPVRLLLRGSVVVVWLRSCSIGLCLLGLEF